MHLIDPAFTTTNFLDIKVRNDLSLRSVIADYTVAVAIVGRRPIHELLGALLGRARDETAVALLFLIIMATVRCEFLLV